MRSGSKLLVIFEGLTGAHGRPARRRRPRRRGARRPDAADRLQRRRPGDAGPGHLLTDRGQPLPGQDRRRRVRPAALPGVADPLPLPAARRQGTGPPDGPPPDPQPRPAAAGPYLGRAGPHPRRDRPQAGRVPVPHHRADQAARHAARPRPPVRGRRGHRGRRRRPVRPRRPGHRARPARRHRPRRPRVQRRWHQGRRDRRPADLRGCRDRAGNTRKPRWPDRRR